MTSDLNFYPHLAEDPPPSRHGEKCVDAVAREAAGLSAAGFMAFESDARMIITED
jgi:hypothetical protein